MIIQTLHQRTETEPEERGRNEITGVDDKNRESAGGKIYTERLRLPSR